MIIVIYSFFIIIIIIIRIRIISIIYLLFKILVVEGLEVVRTYVISCPCLIRCSLLIVMLARLLPLPVREVSDRETVRQNNVISELLNELSFFFSGGFCVA